MTTGSPATLAPIVKHVTVPLAPDDAFEVFTDIGRWWPLDSHAVERDTVVACAIEEGVGGQVLQVNFDGTSDTWGEVLVWEPGVRLVFTWHPGRAARTAQEVEVTFAAVDGEPTATEVTLTHRGWETLGDTAAAQHGDYLTGWDHVFGTCFRTAATPTRTPPPTPPPPRAET